MKLSYEYVRTSSLFCVICSKFCIFKFKNIILYLENTTLKIFQCYIRSQYDVLAWNWNKMIICLVHNYNFGLNHFVPLQIKVWKLYQECTHINSRQTYLNLPVLFLQRSSGVQWLMATGCSGVTGKEGRVEGLPATSRDGQSMKSCLWRITTSRLKASG